MRSAVVIQSMHGFGPILRRKIDMHAIVSPVAYSSATAEDRAEKPSDADVEGAFRTVLSWIGEDQDREGLRETPARVVRALKEHFSGYAQIRSCARLLKRLKDMTRW